MVKKKKEAKAAQEEADSLEVGSDTHIQWQGEGMLEGYDAADAPVEKPPPVPTQGSGNFNFAKQGRSCTPGRGWRKKFPGGIFRVRRC